MIERHKDTMTSNKARFIAQRARPPDLRDVLNGQNGCQRKIRPDAGLLPMRPVEDCVIGSIAAWWMAIHRSEGHILELEWLVVGLCQGMIASEFTGDIQTYLLNLVKEQAQEIDKAVAPPRGTVKPFEERWTQQVDIG